MRLILHILLVVLTAAGPWVCCCTTAVISRAVTKWSPVTANKRQPIRTCCHQTPPRKSASERPADKQNSAGVSTKQPERHDPAPQDRTCPCHDQRQEPVVLEVSDDSRLTLGSRDFAPTGVFLIATLALRSLGGIPCAAPPPGALLPFMSTDERLHAHHALRC
jgi:hypothetical protein